MISYFAGKHSHKALHAFGLISTISSENLSVSSWSFSLQDFILGSLGAVIVVSLFASKKIKLERFLDRCCRGSALLTGGDNPENLDLSLDSEGRDDANCC